MLQSGTIYLEVQRITFTPSSFYAFQAEKLLRACKEFGDLCEGWMALTINSAIWEGAQKGNWFNTYKPLRGGFSLQNAHVLRIYSQYMGGLKWNPAKKWKLH